MAFVVLGVTMNKTEAEQLAREIEKRSPSTSVHVVLWNGELSYISCWEKEVIVSKLKPIEGRFVSGS